MALVPIVTGAGGKFTDWNGGRLRWRGSVDAIAEGSSRGRGCSSRVTKNARGGARRARAAMTVVRAASRRRIKKYVYESRLQVTSYLRLSPLEVRAVALATARATRTSSGVTRWSSIARRGSCIANMRSMFWRARGTDRTPRRRVREEQPLVALGEQDQFGTLVCSESSPFSSMSSQGTHGQPGTSPGTISNSSGSTKAVALAMYEPTNLSTFPEVLRHDVQRSVQQRDAVRRGGVSHLEAQNSLHGRLLSTPRVLATARAPPRALSAHDRTLSWSHGNIERTSTEVSAASSKRLPPPIPHLRCDRALAGLW